MLNKKNKTKSLLLIKQLKTKFNCDDLALYKLLSSCLNSKNLQNEQLTLIVKEINVKYKNIKLLNNVSFEIHPNSFHVFIGENGAGKSTTIKALIGIINNYEGKIYFKELNRFDPNKIAYVPDQQPKFPKHMNIYEYLFNTTKLLTNFSNDFIKDMIKKYIKKYDLENVIKNSVNKLSTGQKQKILLISAFLLKRKIIILDEPFANLDPTSRFKFLDELKKMTANGTSIFLSSHILEEIKDLADYVTFIRKGKVIYSKPVDDKEFIISFYKNNYIKSFDHEFD